MIGNVLTWLFQPGLHLTIVIIVLALLIVVPAVAWVMRGFELRTLANKPLRRYLQSVYTKNQDLTPTGFAQSEDLRLTSVPLSEIFIHLRAVPDRPRHDVTNKQDALIEALSRNAQLSPEEREAQIQSLRAQWYSQEGFLLAEKQQSTNADITEVMQRMTAEYPIAVILGTPGSGKSTTMNWLALHMARAYFARRHRLPQGLAPLQIPVLLRIRDYAARLNAAEAEHKTLSLQQFLKDYLADVYSELPNLLERLRAEMEKGHCIFLFDGLDEVASDDLRRRVAQNIGAFISDNLPENAQAKRFNRFLITSRIVGYDAGTFAKYAHYTLLDLEDEQIKDFLAHWCPAVELHLMKPALGRRKLTEQQQETARKAGAEQQSRLLAALDNSPGIKRLAVNPLMLTILALLQKSGKTLPHRRIDLYYMVTRTLLANWNYETGRRVFPEGELPLAEQMLGNLAYTLHSRDLLLTEQEVKSIAQESMTEFYAHAASENDIHLFIQTLRRSSGLFVESGQGLFSFMHRTFQEYYVARYLLRKTSEFRIDFARNHFHNAIWREPLLLTIAAKSGQTSQTNRSDWQEASATIQAIAATNEPCDAFLQRGLLFAANSLVDCETWTIDHNLQRGVANQLFDLYGDTYGRGRYTQLQQEIERIALFWLRGQPKESSQQNTWPPLLDAWRKALCDDKNSVRQEGAVHLLASIVPDLPSCPPSVLLALTPPLLQLADVLDMSFPPDNMRACLPQPTARPSSLKTEEYAFVALRLLDASGPAGWLHKQWLQWSEEQPELLERLTRHSLEIDALLTPAAFPSGPDDPNWYTYISIVNDWKKRGQRNPQQLQRQLLQASNAARYPYAYLYKQALARETAVVSSHGNNGWFKVWNGLLKEEMARGRSATFQTNLYLRLLLNKGDQTQNEAIAQELMTALSSRGWQTMQAVTSIINIYLRDLIDLIDLRYLRDLRDLRDLRYLLNKEAIIGLLCNKLKQSVDEAAGLTLLAVYSVLTSYEDIPLFVREQVSETVKFIEHHTGLLDPEYARLIEIIVRLIAGDARPQIDAIRERTFETPEKRAEDVYSYLPSVQFVQLPRLLTKGEAEELLAACTDTRTLSKDMREKVGNAYSVQKVAWNMSEQQINMEVAAQQVVVNALDDDLAIVCAAAARLLQHSKGLSPVVREEAMKKMMTILTDDGRSRRPLDTPDYEVWRLDDVLFEALGVLAERGE